jgi:hypothetical protein
MRLDPLAILGIGKALFWGLFFFTLAKKALEKSREAEELGSVRPYS